MRVSIVPAIVVVVEEKSGLKTTTERMENDDVDGGVDHGRSGGHG